MKHFSFSRNIATALTCAALCAPSLLAQNCETQLTQVFGDSQFLRMGFRDIAISGDTLVVSEESTNPNSEIVRVYEGVDGFWSSLPTQEIDLATELFPSNGFVAQFGSAIAIRDNLMVIGAPRFSSNITILHGIALVFERQVDGTWTHLTTLFTQSQDAEFYGSAVAITPDGRVCVGVPGYDSVSGGPDTGRVFIYERIGNFFVATGPAIEGPAGSSFGRSIAASDDYLVVGAPTGSNTSGAPTGTALAYDISTATPTLVGQLDFPGAANGDEVGDDVAITRGWIGVTAVDEPGVAMFQANANGTFNSTPNTVLTITGSGSFGFARRIAMEGSHLVVGASVTGLHGAIFSYQLTGGAWTLDAQIDSPAGGASPSSFGYTVATDGVSAAIGDPFLDASGGIDSGGGYVWALDTEFGDKYCGGDTGGADLTIQGSPWVTVNCVDLVVTGMPPNAAGYFAMSLQPAVPSTPLGNGELCLGSPIVRLPTVQADGMGNATLNLGLPSQVLADSKWHFQLIHRDGGSINTSNALRVIFR